MTPLQFTRNVRSLNRLRQIALVLTQHGFGHFVARINLTRFLPVWMLRRKARKAPMDDGLSALGKRLVSVCNELGPTFIKLGQLLSTRPDLLPAEMVDEFYRLQDNVEPFPTDKAMAIIADELGKPVEECFAHIDTVPLASGSIGQAYAARSHEGAELIVKVRRPDIEHTIRHDLQLLEWLAESMESLVPELQPYQPTAVLAELGQLLTREMDYINEASATERFAEAFEKDEGIVIPRVYWEYTGNRVMTMQRLRGINAAKLLSQKEEDSPVLDRRLIAQRLARCYLKQIFELGVVHSDPHPGNLLISPPATVGLIDFGQVGTLTTDFMSELIMIIYACVKNEMSVVIDTLADMGALGAQTDRRLLERALQALLDKYYGLTIRRLDVAAMLNEFVDVTRQNDVVIPREMAQLIKTAATISGVIQSIDPEFDLLVPLKPALKKTMREQFSPQRVQRALTMVGWDVLTVARKAPRHLRELMRAASTRGWQLHVKHENIDRLISELDRSSNRLAFAVVIAAIIVGSSVVVSVDSSVELFGFKVQYFGVLGYLIAGVLGLGLSWAIFRSGRLH